MRVVKRIVVVAAMFLCGCLAPQNSIMVDVDMHSWNKSDSLIYENSDTLSLRNLNIALRYNNDFTQTSLPLKIAITAPDARYFDEIIELKLQRKTRTLMVATTESIPYRNRVLLNQIGAYTISFSPISEVKGIEAIGIEFTKNDGQR